MLLYVYFEESSGDMRYRRKLHKRELKRQRKIIILSLLTVLLCFSIGYASFSTNINLSTQGNVYKVSDKCYTTSDNGDGTLTITNYDKTCGTEVNIPSIIRGKTVTVIAGNVKWDDHKSFSYKGLTKVVIPDTVITIGNNSFRSNNITSLDLGGSVKSIGWEAFAYNKLTNIVFPKFLTTIGAGAFQENNLTSIPSLEHVISLCGGVFTGNLVTGHDKFVYSKYGDNFDYSTLNSYAGPWVSGLVIPSNVKTPMYYSLRRTRATTVILSEGVENINDSAFMQSYATTVNIPSTIKNIGASAFGQSRAIKTININRKDSAIAGTPWGASNATVNWTGDN